MARRWRCCSRVPALYLVAALIGSLVPVNRGWTEPRRARPSTSPTTASTPTSSCRSGAGARLGAADPEERLCRRRPDARWIAFGSGEERVYLNTPTWWDITPRTIWSALAGGKRVMHVEYVPSPDYAVRADPAAPRRISAALGRDPRRLRARCARPAAADRPSRLRPLRRFLPRGRQGKHVPHLQQLGRATGCGSRASRPACGRRSSRGWSGDTAIPGWLL